MGVATEAQIQQTIVDGLHALKFHVLTTDRPRFKCPHCGHVRYGGDGVSRGLPDVMFTHPSWPLGVWAGIEVKKSAKAKVRPEQQTLKELMRVLVTWDPDHALDYARSLHEVLTGTWPSTALFQWGLRWRDKTE